MKDGNHLAVSNQTMQKSQNRGSRKMNVNINVNANINDSHIEENENS